MNSVVDEGWVKAMNWRKEQIKAIFLWSKLSRNWLILRHFYIAFLSLDFYYFSKCSASFPFALSFTIRLLLYYLVLCLSYERKSIVKIDVTIFISRDVSREKWKEQKRSKFCIRNEAWCAIKCLWTRKMKRISIKRQKSSTIRLSAFRVTL